MSYNYHPKDNHYTLLRLETGVRSGLRFFAAVDNVQSHELRQNRRPHLIVNNFVRDILETKVFPLILPNEIREDSRQRCTSQIHHSMWKRVLLITEITSDQSRKLKPVGETICTAPCQTCSVVPKMQHTGFLPHITMLLGSICFRFPIGTSLWW